jgi:hypothetical protein
MNEINLEVLIPVQGRKTLIKTILSLIDIDLIDLITIITTDELDFSETRLAENGKLRIIKLPKQVKFVKSFYLNQGIKSSLGQLILISDADIIWNERAVEELYHSSFSHCKTIAHIADVQESESQNYALKRSRFTPVVVKVKHQHFQVKIVSTSVSLKRPGCGLICTQRDTLLSLGGFNESLQGWGWEDQDLLIRGQILDCQIVKVGEVIHLSHDDSLRNQSGMSPIDTRNKNILLSCQRLIKGIVRGDLADVDKMSNDSLLTIAVEIPSFINNCNKI